MNGQPHRKMRFAVGLVWLLLLSLGAAENQKREEHGGVLFDSDYDNGSIGEVSQEATDTFSLQLYEEVGELGTRRYWFRLRLSGLEGRAITLRLDHSENPRPFLRESGQPWRRMTSEEAPDLETLVVTLKGESNPVELAFFEPLSVSETEEALALLTARIPEMVTTEVIGKSDEERPLTLLTLTDPRVPAEQKRRVWVHSRAHAGEVTSTHSLLGFVDQVLEDSPRGRILRSELIVHVLPLLNPDGVHRGYTRWDVEGRDPESQWCAIDSPAVQAVKDRVDLLMNEPVPISLALNLHSTRGVYEDTFFFKHLVPSVTSNFERIQQRYIDALAEATSLFENRSPGSSQLHTCRFIESYFWNEWGEEVMALTHEGHYHKRITDGDWIVGGDYRAIGKGMARALVDYYELPAGEELAWDAWLAQHFDSLERRFENLVGPEADPDGDGIANLFEYGRGTDPREADSVVEGLRIHSDQRVTFTRSTLAADIDWAVESSADLEAWQELPVEGWEFTAHTLERMEKVTVPISRENEDRYLRLRAVLNKDR